MTKTCCDCKVVFPAWGTSSHCTSLNGGVSSPDSSGSLQLQPHQMMSTQNENHSDYCNCTCLIFGGFSRLLYCKFDSGSLTFVKKSSLPIFRHLYRMKHLWDRILTRRWMGTEPSQSFAYANLLRFSDNHSRFWIQQMINRSISAGIFGSCENAFSMVVISFPSFSYPPGN